MIGTEVTAFSRQDWGVGRGGAGTAWSQERERSRRLGRVNAREAVVSALVVVRSQEGRARPVLLAAYI